MMEHEDPTSEITFVDTPRGIFTAAGIWFRATKVSLETYAGPVLEHEPIERLLGRAEIWLRSPEAVALWVLPLFMLMIEPVPAALSALTVYVGWKTLGPSLVSRWFEQALGLLDRVWLQGLYYVGVLSYLAAIEQFAAVWMGLAGFILLRWGVVGWVTSPLVRLIWASLYELPIPDQVLRGFIIRAAMRYRVSLPQLDRLERQILDMFSKT